MWVLLAGKIWMLHYGDFVLPHNSHGLHMPYDDCTCGDSARVDLSNCTNMKRNFSPGMKLVGSLQTKPHRYAERNNKVYYGITKVCPYLRPFSTDDIGEKDS